MRPRLVQIFCRILKPCTRLNNREMKGSPWSVGLKRSCLHTHSTTCKFIIMFYPMELGRGTPVLSKLVVGGTPVLSNGLVGLPLFHPRGWYGIPLFAPQHVPQLKIQRSMLATLKSCRLLTKRQDQLCTEIGSQVDPGWSYCKNLSVGLIYKWVQLRLSSLQHHNLGYFAWFFVWKHLVKLCDSNLIIQLNGIIFNPSILWLVFSGKIQVLLTIKWK